MTTLNDFKNKILFRAIHEEERSSKFHDVLKDAESLIRLKRENSTGDSSYVLFQRLILKIEYTTQLIQLCADLKAQGFPLQWSVQVSENYYEDVFSNRIERGKKAMRNLRSYILKYTENWTEERKQADIDHAESGKYFKKLYNIKTLSK